MRVFKLLKKSLAVGALTLVVAAAAVPASTAFANNHYDKLYSSYAAAHGVSYTSAQEKWDRSSSWDDCRGGANHTVEVAATPWSYWSVTFVGSPIYGWWNGKADYLINYVGEEGYGKALLWFTNPNNYATTISGFWSPDSI